MQSENSTAVAEGAKPRAAAKPQRAKRAARASLAVIEGDKAAALPEIAFPDKGRGGKPLATYLNARAALQACGLEYSFDVFADRPFVNGAPLRQYAGGFSDKMASVLRQHVTEKFGFDPGKSNVYDAVLQLCLENSFNPVRDYLDALTWDGKPRLAHWLHTYAGAEDSEINQAFGAAFLVAAVRRVRDPGCKFDHFLMLKGRQGCGKSTLVSILAGNPDHFTDQELVHLQAREQQEAISGKWFVEASELAGFGRAGVERIKAFASRTHDRARPAYGRTQEDRPRACVFVATTNEAEPLSDGTGNRRFWPVEVGKVDLAALRRDRDQLFAEACAIEAKGAPLGLSEKLWSVAAQAQMESTEGDPWSAALAKLRGTHEHGSERLTRYQVSQFVTDQLAIPVAKQDQRTIRRVRDCLVLLGWTYKTLRIAGDIQKGYER